jgi:HAD superfamily hydrolase (TIGR01450 family)
VESYEAFLLDLDGTLHRGDDPVPGAASCVRRLRESARSPVFVTNNASRTPAQVVEHLAGVGIVADTSEVLTSAQAGARVVAARVPPGSRVLVVGGDGLVEAVRESGLVPVGRAEADVAAVVQGWWPGLSWSQLAEGAYALAAGVPWVATNDDLTLPTDRGVAPGNGSFIRLLGAVAGRGPDEVAGKPGPALLTLAAAGRRGLVVGDRLDTDIAGAAAAGLDSLLVLSGVATLAEVLVAPPGQRPTYVCRDLDGLFAPYLAARSEGGGRWSCGSVMVEVGRTGHLAVVGAVADGGEQLLRAACAAVWHRADQGAATTTEQVQEQLAALLR